LGMMSESNGLGEAAPTAQQFELLVQLTDESWSSLWPEAGSATWVQDDPFQWNASEQTTSPGVVSSVPPTPQFSSDDGQPTEKSNPPIGGLGSTDQWVPPQ